MKIILITIIGLVVFTSVRAQQKTSKDANDTSGVILISKPSDSTDDKSAIFTAVEQEPSFPGGINKFFQFLQSNIRYPAAVHEGKVHGNVFVTFVVEKDGSITNVKIARGIESGCDEEAVRLMKISPKWLSGRQNGKPVRVQYTLPINFTFIGQ